MSEPVVDGGAALDGIAIIGMAGRFPGAADVQHFWWNICNGIDSISRFAPGQLEDAFSAQQRADPAYVPVRSVLEGVELFDAEFFGMQPREAALTDPQHRVFLECCWEAFEDAGHDPAGANVGVFAGCSMPTYLMQNVCADRDAIEGFTSGYQVDNYQQLLGSIGDVLATRVSYKLDLRGPSMTIQTACSTSLVAVTQAWQALLLQQCDMALAGGVSITFPQHRGYRHTEGGMVSKDGRCRPFDAQASGTVFGSGSGVVLLKRLADALADGDRIHAVIRGFAINNDGAVKVGFTAPSVDAQAAVIATAHAVAGVEASSIGYVECHGTATPLGDPIEVAALTRAFRQTTDATGFCAIGSVKGNVGHLDAAAGVTGLIKAVLAVREGKIPATMYFQSPNPRLDLAGSPFFVADRLTPWRDADRPRCAGVSALGVGGTNVHVLVEQAPVAQDGVAPARACEVLTLSARSEAALGRARLALGKRLLDDPALDLGDVAYSLRRRRGFAHRCMMVAGSTGEAATRLTETPAQRFSAVVTQAPAVLFLFPGQGSQYPGMGSDLYRDELVFREAIDRCAVVLGPLLGEDLRTVLYGGNSADTLSQTRLAQPIIFSVSYALARLWMSWGIRPAAMIGHSVGEFVAACLSGVFGLEDALGIIAARGRLMQSLPCGVMLAVRLPEAELLPLLGADLDLAAVNGPSLCVVAGAVDAIAPLEQALLARGTMSRRLHTSHAFHSAMMEPILQPMAALLRPIGLGAPGIPYVSCVTGEWITAAEAGSPQYWARHCRAPVRFGDALNTLLASQHGPCVLLEVGAGTTLGTLARAAAARAGGGACTVLASLPDPARESTGHRTMAEALGSLWVAGAAPDWQKLTAPGRRLLSLPGYPFERTRHWIDAPRAARQPQSSGPKPAISAPNGNGAIETATLSILQGLSGSDLSQCGSGITFLELGFDSLLLSQVAQDLQDRFGVKISFRQLLGELSTVTALTRFISQSLPNSPARVQATEPVSLPLSSQPESDAVERLLHGQLQTMQQVMAAQLEALRGLDRPAPVAVPTPAAVPIAVELTNRFSRFSSPAQVGPVADALDARQARFLDDLIVRQDARTAISKAMTQLDRAVLADPRVASGFRQEWKELVYPIVCDRAAGARLWDVDGNEYIDLVNGFGLTAFGHSPDFVIEAVSEQLRRGFPIGPQADLAGKVARLISEMTGDERVSFCCTGSEAVMGALRLTRAVTGRKRVVSFAGAYHGGFDEVLVRGLQVDGAPRSLPAAPGVMPEAVANMTILEYGEPKSLAWIRAHGHELAAVLVEPVQSRHPALRPREFLHQLRAITEASGTALIFDEVVTGFRLHPGGAQALFGVRADLATYGKVLAGGMPIGVLAGKPHFMDALDGGFWRYGDASAPEAAVTVFAGTFVRHPLALAAAWAVLKHLKAEGPAMQIRLGERTACLIDRLNAFLAVRGIRSRIEHCGSMFHFHPAAEDRRASLLFYLLRERGIYVQENFPLFLTTAHSDADLAAIERAFKESVDALQSVGILASMGTVAGLTAVPEAPLTEPQLEILLSAQFGDDASCAYNESLSLELAGPLDHAMLRDALDVLVARHDALRARVVGDAMHIVPHLSIPIEERNCPVTSDSQGADMLAAMLEEAARTPFDLILGPLLRATLVRRAAEDHVLVLTFHHIICDGWSINVMLADLAALYDASRGGRHATLAPAPSFAAHALAERTYDAAAAADERYWMDCFAILPPSLELPADRPRAAIKTFRGATVQETIDSSLYQSVRGVGARLGCTPFATMLAAFQLLLGRLADQQEVVVGVPTAGQSLLDDRALVGHCVNFLPIPAQWDSATTLAQHLISVQATLMKAREHPRCTLGTLVRRLGVSRNPNRLPLTDVQFNFERVGAPASFGGLQASARANPKAFVNFDLFFNLVETQDGLRLECDYSTDLFDDATVRRWIGHYRTLLATIAADAGLPAVRAKLLDAGDLRELSRHNDTAAPFQADRGFHDLFAEQARNRPDAIAAECGETRWTYAELDRRSDEVAAHLRVLVPTGNARVGVLMERSLELPAALLAVAKAGLAYVPLDPRQPPARLLRIIEQSDLAALLTDGLVAVPDCAVQLIDLSQPLHRGSKATDAWRPVKPLAYVIYTSGSTGLPKGVEIGHRALTNLLVSMAARPGLHEDDVLLAITTVAFDIAALELFLPLTVGARVVIARDDELSDGFALLSRMRSRGVTVMQATPATWLLLLEAGFRSHPGLKMLCGGEALPRQLADRLLEGGGALWNMYGPTETTIWSSTGLVRSGQDPISIGRPIANTRFHLLDRHGELALPGARGQLHIAGDGLAEGYSADPVQTAARFIADPFESGRLHCTGDLARRLPNGEIQLLGRLDDQVKLRGFRIELGEIEAALLSQGGVAAVAVLLRTDPPRAASYLVAYYVELPGRPRRPAELEAAVTETLPSYMVPTAFVRLAALPMTTNGKVDRKALPVPDELAQSDGGTPRAALTTSLQRRLGAIWQEVLGLETVGAEDDLLALGADSIHIFQIAARANRAGIAAAAKDILRHRTIAALSAVLETSTPGVDTDPAAVRLPTLSQFRRVMHHD
jgi:amino acid adenylation domain-containing protein